MFMWLEGGYRKSCNIYNLQPILILLKSLNYTSKNPPIPLAAFKKNCSWNGFGNTFKLKVSQTSASALDMIACETSMSRNLYLKHLKY